MSWLALATAFCGYGEPPIGWSFTILGMEDIVSHHRRPSGVGVPRISSDPPTWSAWQDSGPFAPQQHDKTAITTQMNFLDAHRGLEELGHHKTAIVFLGRLIT